VRLMSEGELLQIEKSRTLNLSEDVYFEIIRNKTASLLASSCAAGAYSTSRNEETAEKMRLFGEKTGMAFQIKDDLFDYGSDDVGKPTGNDIKEKKITLPLIYTLNKVSRPVRRELIDVIRNHNRDKVKVKQVIDVVISEGGIDYTKKRMETYRDEALDILNTFSNDEVRQALEQLVRYTTDRNH
jgi:octaprenyl-diphosphate synthase